MIDFFDEDFPLTKKQEALRKAMDEAEKNASLPQPPSQAVLEDVSANPPADGNQTSNAPAETAAPEAETAIEAAEAAEVADAEPEAYAEDAAGSESEPAPAAEAAESPSVPEDVPQPETEDVCDTIAEAETVAADNASAEEVCEEPSDIFEPEAAEEAPDEAVSESREDAAPAANVTEDVCDTVAEDETVADEAASAEEVCEEPSDIFEPEAAEEAPAESVPLNPAAEDSSVSVEAEPTKASDGPEDDGIGHIFTPDPESDNQEFSYEYDGRYFAEEETPAYRYGAVRTRPRSRPAKTPDKGSITVSTKTLLKVGAIVAAAAAAIKLLDKKD